MPKRIKAIIGEHVTVKIAKCNGLHAFKVMPKCWAVERSFTWFEKHRRLWKNFERSLNTSLQFIILALILNDHKHTLRLLNFLTS